MIIGIDFDNTIVTYDRLFWSVAREQGLIPESVAVAKNEVRNYLRGAGMEQTWIEMQGYVYGARMNEAEPAAGVLDFFRECCARRVPVLIISHKTRRPYAGPDYDLHAAAQGWLQKHGFFERLRIGTCPAERFLRPDQAGEDCADRPATLHGLRGRLAGDLRRPGFPARREEAMVWLEHRRGRSVGP